jgi:hypothetical protein
MLLFDPRTIDQDRIAAAIEQDGQIPRIQFSNPATCTKEILAQVNACCIRFGAKVCVRFWSHKTGIFDFQILEQIPSVRALILDVGESINVRCLAQLESIEDLAIGFLDGDGTNPLEFENLLALRRLTLLPARNSGFNLAPLAGFRALQDLTLCGHGRNVEVLATLDSVRKLGLSSMKRTISLEAVRAMTGLSDLWIVLGGRSSTNQFAHPRVRRLRIDQIQGLHEIDLSGFPSLEQLCIENQSRIDVLDLNPVRKHLRYVQIFNMKTLARLAGIDQMTQLETLWLGQCPIDPDDLLDRLPRCLRQVSLSGYGKIRGEKLKQRIRSMNLEEAHYLGMLGM